MNLSNKIVLKCLSIVSLIYLTSILIISVFFGQNNENENLLTQTLSKNSKKITFILLEFESFENDLTETLISLCHLMPFISVIIVSEIPIYPPIRYPNSCDISFIDNSFHFNQSLIESRIESHINSEYIIIIGDNIRIHSIHSVFNSINYLKQLNLNQRTALIVSIDSDSNVFNKTQFKSDNCLQIAFDIKSWTLIYSQNISSESCDAFGGNNYAVLITRTHLLQLNYPFVRPFIESFFIQSKINKIRLKFFDGIVFSRGPQLFANNGRNKWKHKLLTKERRKSLFKLIGIKKVVESDGSVHWFGCSKQTNRCFGTVIDEMPDYLFTNRWTPVCCIENLAKTGRHVFKILESYSVRYWLEGGSLLGAARNGQIIPWDYDIDIGIYSEDIQKCPYFPKNSSIVDQKGFVWEKAMEGDFYRVQFSQSNRLHVDIFPFYSMNGTMTKNTWFESHRQDREFAEHFLKPLTKIRFIEWFAFAPNNVQKFLEFKFGENVIQNPKYPKPELLEFPKHIPIFDSNNN